MILRDSDSVLQFLSIIFLFPRAMRKIDMLSALWVCMDI